MAVKVSIVNPEKNVLIPECVAAETLKDILIESFNNTPAKGEVYIAYALTLSGQDVKNIDLLLFGKLENYVLPKFYTNDIHCPKKDLTVDSFCVAIELKEHTFERLEIHDTHICVKYNDYWKDATEQNKAQRYALASYIQNEIGHSPYITDLVWLKSLTNDQLKSLSQNNEIGALSMNFSFMDIVRIIIAHGATPSYNQVDGCYHIDSELNHEHVEKLKSIINK